jgi:predicted nucleic acid-binding protein
MRIVIDTSALIAVITNEPSKKRIIEVSLGCDLIAPSSVHWEIANAFSAMYKQKRVNLENSIECVKEYKKIPIQFYEVDLVETLELSYSLSIYAYDAFLIACSQNFNAPLLTLDRKLNNKGAEAGIKTLEV